MKDSEAFILINQLIGLARSEEYMAQYEEKLKELGNWSKKLIKKRKK
jgi:hypothetical protein